MNQRFKAGAISRANPTSLKNKTVRPKVRISQNQAETRNGDNSVEKSGSNPWGVLKAVLSVGTVGTIITELLFWRYFYVLDRLDLFMSISTLGAIWPIVAVFTGFALLVLSMFGFPSIAILSVDNALKAANPKIEDNFHIATWPIISAGLSMVPFYWVFKLPLWEAIFFGCAIQLAVFSAILLIDKKKRYEFRAAYCSLKFRSVASLAYLYVFCYVFTGVASAIIAMLFYPRFNVADGHESGSIEKFFCTAILLFVTSFPAILVIYKDRPGALRTNRSRLHDAAAIFATEIFICVVIAILIPGTVDNILFHTMESLGVRRIATQRFEIVGANQINGGGDSIDLRLATFDREPGRNHVFTATAPFVLDKIMLLCPQKTFLKDDKTKEVIPLPDKKAQSCVAFATSEIRLIPPSPDVDNTGGVKKLTPTAH